MSKSKKVNIGESIVPYTPQNYYSPFGSVTYQGGAMNVNPSAEYGQQISTRQRLINELLPELDATRGGQNQRIQNMTDLLNQQLLQYAEPQMYGSFAARGMGDSTLANNSLNDLRIKAANQAIFGGQDLYNQELQNMLATGGFLQGGLNDIYQQMMGIGNQGQANNQQYFGVQNANADRLLQGNMANAKLANDRNAGMMNDLGNLGAMAAMFVPGMQGPAAAYLAARGGGGVSNLNNLFTQQPMSYGNTGNLYQDNSRVTGAMRGRSGYPTWY